MVKYSSSYIRLFLLLWTEKKRNNNYAMGFEPMSLKRPPLCYCNYYLLYKKTKGN